MRGSVLLRKEQYRRASDEEGSLHLATRFLQAKLHNSSTVLRHYARDYPDLRESAIPVLDVLGAALERASEPRSLQDVRGVEGDCARRYFSIFAKLLRIESGDKLFAGRSRRPSKDPVNAALSLLYSILSREIATACESVGLDPQLGYLHACRPGRASLALDLIEELRAPFVDRFVLSLFNRRQVKEADFSFDAEGGCFFNERSLKKVLGLWQRRKQEEVIHPFLKERVPMGVIPFIQAQLLARYLHGDLDDYPACLWR